MPAPSLPQPAECIAFEMSRQIFGNTIELHILLTSFFEVVVLERTPYLILQLERIFIVNYCL